MRPLLITTVLFLTACSSAKPPTFHYFDIVEVKDGFYKGCFGIVAELRENPPGNYLYTLDHTLCPQDGGKQPWKIEDRKEGDLAEGTMSQRALVNEKFEAYKKENEVTQKQKR